MAELLSRVEKYINSKETVKFEVPVNEREPNRAMKRKDKEENFNNHNKRLRFEWRESKLPPLNCNNYTPLNTAWTNIHIEI